MRITYSIAFLIFFILLNLSCKKKDLDPDDSGNIQNLENIDIGTTVEVSSTSIGINGGSIIISKPDTPVDGLEITIPPNAYTSSQTFTVSYSEIVSHKLGENFDPISPMISIACDGGYSNELISVTIPVEIPEGHIPIGFFLDAVTGKLEGIPVESVSSNSITLLTRHFLSGNMLKSASADDNKGANIIISSISESVLNSLPVITSGFAPGVDDWEFVNDGSYIATGGHCSGQNIAAMWYYFEKKTTEGNLFNRFSTNPNLWQDNSRGYRFCSVIHKDLDWDGAVTNMFKKYINKNQELDRLKLLTIAGAILVTGEPQGIGIYRQKGTYNDGSPKYEGHDLICYQVSVSDGKLYISDPNTPGTGQVVEFANNKFQPYMAKLNGHDVSNAYPYVTWYAKTAYIEWDKIGKRWDELLDNTIGTIASNTFPSYKIWVDDEEDYELEDGLFVNNEKLKTFVTCPDAEVHFPVDGQKRIGLYVFNQSGVRIDVQRGVRADVTLNFESDSYVILKPGLNILGYYVVGAKVNSKDKFGFKYNDLFVDFKWVNVNYIPLTIFPNPIIGEPDKDILITAKSNGTAPSNAKYVWKFGDGSQEVTILNDSTVTYNYEKTGNFQVELKLYDNATNKLVASATAVANIENSLFANTEWRKSYQDGQSASITFTGSTYSVYMGIGNDYHFTIMGGGTYVATGNTAILTPYSSTTSDIVTIEGGILTYMNSTYTKVE